MRKLHLCKFCGAKPLDLHRVGCPIIISQHYIDTGKRN